MEQTGLDRDIERSGWRTVEGEAGRTWVRADAQYAAHRKSVSL